MNQDLASAVPSSSWFTVLSGHARNHVLTALSLGIATLAALILLAQSLAWVLTGEEAINPRYALLGGMAGFTATTLGAVPILVLRGIPQQLEDSLLGMAAGMMLAASAFSLLLPGLDAGTEILGDKLAGAGVVVFGMALGVLLMLG